VISIRDLVSMPATPRVIIYWCLRERAQQQQIRWTPMKLCMLAFARTRPPLSEILLWMTPSEPPRALQASECSELLDPTRASCLIPAQRQPGKFTAPDVQKGSTLFLKEHCARTYKAKTNYTDRVSSLKDCWGPKAPQKLMKSH